MENTSVRKVISILLILAVVFSLASCKKVEADYIFEIKNANRSHYYSVSNDTFEKISRVQYNSALEFGNSYSSAPRVPEIVLISAEGNDPSHSVRLRSLLRPKARRSGYSGRARSRE